MTHIDANDPRLTAYALGELDASEAAAIEQQLQRDAALRETVDEIRRTSEMLRHEFAAEPALGLTQAQREIISHRPEPDVVVLNRPWIFRTRALWWSVGAAAAACLALAILLPNFSTARRDFAHGSREHSPPVESVQGMVNEFAEGDKAANSATSGPAAMGGQGVDEIRAGRTLRPNSSPRESELLAEAKRSEIRDDLAASGGGGGLGGMRGGPPASPANAPAGSDAVTGRPAQDARTRREVQSLRPLPTNSDGMPVQQSAERLQGGAAIEAEAAQHGEFNTEQYNLLIDNPFIQPIGEKALSTFGIDVDTGSYSNIRRFLSSGQVPPKDAVRIEEVLNYFPYNYEAPSGAHPFSTNIEVCSAPWNPKHRLVRIGLKGKEIKQDMRPATSLIFLIDVSGSMRAANKLPLVQQSLELLVNNLHGDDRLAIVTYAGQSGLLLDSIYCSGDNKPRILEAIGGLSAGGSTNGAGGITMAYDVARQHLIEGGVNRVILCTDGDFNVGVSSDAELVRMIEEKRATGIFLSVLGFGTGNLKEGKMEQLANKGNGNFAFIDGIEEAKKVLVEQMAGTLVTIAKDVKIQVEFNPATVGAYRLIGYENRALAARDFNDDTKDAGEIGAGHTVTALYEIIPVGMEVQELVGDVDELRYQKPAAATSGAAEALAPGDPRSNELLTLKLRYKQPDGDESTLMTQPVTDDGRELDLASMDFQFASAVAAFGMVLRDSPYKGQASIGLVLDLAQAGAESDMPYRAEFIELVKKAAALSGSNE